MGFGASFIRYAPSDRAPVPQSRMNRAPEFVTTSTQDVLPPNSFVDGPGVAIEPRVPQKRRYTVILRLSVAVLQLNTIQILRKSVNRFANQRGVSRNRGFFEGLAQVREHREAIPGARAPHFVRESLDGIEVMPRERFGVYRNLRAPLFKVARDHILHTLLHLDHIRNRSLAVTARNHRAFTE